jgi:DNA-binding NarL/FixJ family response regulator
MKVIIVSVHGQSNVSHSVLEAGADGFVIKRDIATDLLPAADAVAAGGRFVSPEADERQASEPVSEQ